MNKTCISYIINEAINESINYFDTNININKHKIETKIITTSDIVNDYKKYATYDKGLGINESYNGVMIPPISNDYFTILLNMNNINNDLKLKKVLIHELTHMLDYIEYLKIINSNDYYNVLYSVEHFIFRLWSEFHAHLISLKYFYNKAIIGIPLKLKKQWLTDINNSLPNSIKNFYLDYISFQPDEQAYYLMRFLAQLVVLQELDPTTITNKNLKMFFKTNKWINDIYILLVKHKCLDDIYCHFSEIENIINLNK